VSKASAGEREGAHALNDRTIVIAWYSGLRKAGERYADPSQSAKQGYGKATTVRDRLIKDFHHRVDRACKAPRRLTLPRLGVTRAEDMQKSLTARAGLFCFERCLTSRSLWLRPAYGLNLLRKLAFTK